ncbi:MAG: hypothetical protein H6765_10465 [Candidatus Peribacteria bacterium]|nr:MAG: hypothetical protein H6765_10465 [Candidatus Peribacteria bacterium]
MCETGLVVDFVYNPGAHDRTWTCFGELDVDYCIASAEYCGDGSVNPREMCDAGVVNGTECSPAYGDSCGYCDTTCQTITLQGGYCGDGVTELAYEECDDGANGDDTDGCTDACAAIVCGDGIVQGDEHCDGGENCDETCNFIDLCAAGTRYLYRWDGAEPHQLFFNDDVVFTNMPGYPEYPALWNLNENLISYDYSMSLADAGVNPGCEIEGLAATDVSLTLDCGASDFYPPVAGNVYVRYEYNGSPYTFVVAINDSCDYSTNPWCVYEATCTPGYQSLPICGNGTLEADEACDD